MADLSPNGLRLTEKLLSLPRNWITAAALASAVGISRRTVLRELPELEKWMCAQGFHFLRSPGLGLMLDEDEERREALRALLDGSQGNASLSKEERRQVLLMRLFASREPMKIYALARELDISENTLSSDLDFLEDTLGPWEISLRRRPGVGVWLEGQPEALRRSLGVMVKDPAYSRDLRALFQGKASPEPFLAALFDPAVSKTVWDILVSFDKEEKLQFSDAQLTSLAVHLILTVRQLREGTANSLLPDPQTDLSQASRLAGQIGHALGVKFTLAEIRNLALYLDAYGQSNGADSREMEIRYLAAYLVQRVSSALGSDLMAHSTLVDDLCNHLRPMLLRLQNHVHNDNPQLDSLKGQYPALWSAVRAACSNAHKAGLCPPIPDDEAGYLAMHIGAVWEQENLVNTRLDIAVVCPYGLASSKFLAAQIQRDFPAIHIAFCGGLQGLDLENLRCQRVDLIVSTVPLKIDFPHIRVNTVLQESDRALLRAAMDAERERGRPAKAPKKDRRAALRYTAEMSSQILSLLNQVTIRTVANVKSKDAFLREASTLFCAEKAQAEAVEALLWQRENLSSTYIKPLRVLLLHCRTDAVRHCRLGYLAAKPAVKLDGQTVLGALVLLAPAEGDIPLEVMQAVSALLIEEPKLMDALRAGDAALAAEILEAGLSQRFREALTMQLQFY